MGCNCNTVKYIKKQKNIYYIDYTVPFNAPAPGTPAVGTFDIGFPMGNQNIKANNALISVDKFTIRAQEILDVNVYPLTFQTSIPTSNCFSGQLSSTLYPQAGGAPSKTNFEDPSPTGYSENIIMKPFSIGQTNGTPQFTEAIAVYQNDNPDRKVICANPMGQKFSVRLFDNTAATGIRSLNATIGTNITFTLRVELLEEDILQ